MKNLKSFVEKYENIVGTLRTYLKNSDFYTCQLNKEVKNNYIYRKNGKLSRIFEYTVYYTNENGENCCVDVFMKAENCRKDVFENEICRFRYEVEDEVVMCSEIFIDVYLEM